MNHINCLNPVLIVNPQINQSCVRFTHVVVDGYVRRITDEQRYRLLNNESPSKVLGIPYAHNINRNNHNNLSDDEFDSVYSRFEDYLEHCYLLHEDTAEILPLYQFVKCGHCDVCNSSKLSSLIQRAAFQAELFRSPVSFVTLTFNESHYNINRQRQFVLFKKRLKSNVDRVFQTLNSSNEIHSKNIKFLAVCEKGKKGREHFHVIIFGLPFFSDIQSEQTYYLHKILQFCWREPQRRSDNKLRFVDFFEYCKKYPKYSKLSSDYDPFSFGFVNIESCFNVSSTVRYITKYLFKNFLNDNLVSKSVSINLGLDFVTNFRQVIKDSSDGSFEYLSVHDNQVHQVTLSKYYIDKLFPPDSKTFPSEFRKSFFDCYTNCCELLSFKYSGISLKPFRHYALTIKTYLEDRFPFMFYVFEDVKEMSLSKKSQFFDGVHQDSNSIHNNVIGYLNQLFSNIESDFDFLDKFEFNYDEFLYRSLERAEYLEKVYKSELNHSQLVDIAHAFRIGIKRNQSVSHI